MSTLEACVWASVALSAIICSLSVAGVDSGLLVFPTGVAVGIYLVALYEFVVEG